MGPVEDEVGVSSVPHGEFAIGEGVSNADFDRAAHWRRQQHSQFFLDHQRGDVLSEIGQASLGPNGEAVAVAFLGGKGNGKNKPHVGGLAGAKRQRYSTGILLVFMRYLNRPLRVIGKNRHVKSNLDVARVDHGHVHVNLLPAVNRNVVRKIGRPQRSVIIVEVNLKRFLCQHRHRHCFCEIHGWVGQRSDVARNGIGVASRRSTRSNEGDIDANRHWQVFENVQRFKVKLR